MAANFDAFFRGLNTRRTSELMLDDNLRQLESRIMENFDAPVTRVSEHIEKRSTDSWADVPVNNSVTFPTSAMEEQTRFEIDEKSAEPLELISTVEIERLFQRILRRHKRQLRERRQHHPPMEYFADGFPVPKEHPDVDEIIVYPHLDSECYLPLEIPHTTGINISASASSESLTSSGDDRQDLAIPACGPMPAFHFVDNNPPASEISFQSLPIDHAVLGYATTTSGPFSGYRPQAVAFPPQITYVAIPKPYEHDLIDVSHDKSSSTFNPFADDGPIVDQSSSEGLSFPENANRGRPVFTDPFHDNRVIFETFGMSQNVQIQSPPKHQYAATNTGYAYIQAKHVGCDQIKSYPSGQFRYSQHGTVSRTNTGDSSSSSSSRTLVDQSEPVAPRISYWVDRFNRLRKL